MKIVLTFDDGFLSHYHIAKTLWERGIRATFFTPTHERRWSTLARHPRILDRLIDMGHEVASHGMYHVDLTELSLSDLEFQLRESAKYIIDIVGKDVIGLAYPYGVYDFRVVAVASKYYSYACGSSLYSWEDPLNISLPRLPYTISRVSVENLPSCLALVKKLLMRLLNKRRKTLSEPVVVLCYHSIKNFFTHLPFLERINGTFTTLYEAFKDII
ncbi:MAG: polysaccharide deacetylase family protein [Thermofilaceae archaeon]